MVSLKYLWSLYPTLLLSFPLPPDKRYAQHTLLSEKPTRYLPFQGLSKSLTFVLPIQATFSKGKNKILVVKFVTEITGQALKWVHQRQLIISAMAQVTKTIRKYREPPIKEYRKFENPNLLNRSIRGGFSPSQNNSSSHHRIAFNQILSLFLAFNYLFINQ